MSYDLWDALEPSWECPHCGWPDCEGYSQYCQNCGKPLWNHCTDPKCPNAEIHEEYIGTGEIDEDTGLGTLPPEYCYCPLCGNKSYFYEQGLISPA